MRLYRFGQVESWKLIINDDDDDDDDDDEDDDSNDLGLESQCKLQLVNEILNLFHHHQFTH